MISPIIFKAEAQLDITEAYSWYERRANGLGHNFLEEIDKCLNIIRESPLIFPKVYKTVRRGLIRRFPFGIFYLIEEVQITILACLHARRNPKTWQKRTQH